MAWSFSGDRDIFSVSEMIQEFKLEDVQKTAPIFDYEKLRWVNGEYLRKKTDEELINLITSFLSSRPPSRDPSLGKSAGFRVKPGMTDKETRSILVKMLPLIRERMKTLGEFWGLAGFFFDRPKEIERPLKEKPLKVIRDVLEDCHWDHEAMEKAIREAAEKNQIKAKDLFMELRLAVTGKTVGPPLLESLEILGKNETIERLKK